MTLINNNVKGWKKATIILALICVSISQAYLLVGFELESWKIAHTVTESIFTQFISAKFVPVAFAKTVTDPHKINPKNLTDIARKIYILESSSGKNDGCKKKGLVNGYGYRQNSSEVKCYDSKTDVKQLVIGWFYNRYQQGDTLNQALCLYNQGRKIETCTYAKNYERIQ